MEDETLIAPILYRKHYYTSVQRQFETPLCIPDLDRIIQQYDALMISATATDRTRSCERRELYLTLHNLHCYSKLIINADYCALGIDNMRRHMVRKNSRIEIQDSVLQFQSFYSKASAFKITGESIDISTAKQITIWMGFQKVCDIPDILERSIVECILR